MENRAEMPSLAEINKCARERFAGRRGSCAGVFFVIWLIRAVLVFGVGIVAIPFMRAGGISRDAMFLLVLFGELCTATLGIESLLFSLHVYRAEALTVGDYLAGIGQALGRKLRGILWLCLLLLLWALPLLAPMGAYVFFGLRSVDAAFQMTALRVLLFMPLVFYAVAFIRGHAYAMQPFILRDCPKVPVRESLKLSARMMKGRKSALFALLLSLLGWWLLALLPTLLATFWPPMRPMRTLCGIATNIVACSFVLPKTAITLAGFYDALKRVLIASGVVSVAEFGPSPEYMLEEQAQESDCQAEEQQ